MIKVNVHDAKTHFSEYLQKIEQGEVIVICRRNVPIAEIHPISSFPKEARPIGLAKGKFEISASFFEPLPDDIIKSFESE